MLAHLEVVVQRQNVPMPLGNLFQNVDLVSNHVFPTGHEFSVLEG